jgi:hypothetical protein
VPEWLRTSQGDENLGVDYLEKIIQISLNIPPLAEPEAETYINLLFAELYLDDEQFAKLRQEADKRRRREQLTVAMNHGIARDVIGEPPVELAAVLRRALTSDEAVVAAVVEIEAYPLNACDSNAAHGGWL